jgi:hypothetical protein
MSTDVQTILAVIASSLAVLKSAYSLGVEMWPEMQKIINNITVLFNAYMSGEEVSDSELERMQAETDAMSEACNALYQKKFGSESSEG